MSGVYDDGGLGLLGDSSRRAIFYLLARRPLSVGELAQLLPISRPAVSQHLRALKNGNLITDHPVGTRRVYRINPDGIHLIQSFLNQVLIDALATAENFPQPSSPPDPQTDQTLADQTIPHSSEPDAKADQTATGTGAATITGVHPRVIS